MPTVLAIAPYFAPCSAVGAYRSIKLARHLPRAGFPLEVLSGTFPGDSTEPALLDALPDGVAVHDRYLSPALLRLQLASRRRSATARSVERGPMMGLDPFHSPFDRYAVHAPHALREALRLGRSSNAELVYASLGPHSAMPVAVAAARLLARPLVLDLRDPWALHETGEGADDERASVRAAAGVVRRLERACLQRAERVVLNTEAMLASHVAAYPFLSGRAVCIRNPFDLDLFEVPRAADAPRRFRVVHLGTLRLDTPIDDLAEGMRLLIDRDALTPDDIELVQVGHAGRHERDVIERTGLQAFVRFEPRLPLRATMSAMRSAHVLVIASTSQVRLRIPHKTYDYVASGMPILAISDNPEIDRLLVGRADNVRVPCRRPAEVAAALRQHLRRFRATGVLPSPAPAPEEMSAAHAASRLARVFEDALAGRSER
jgi:glycosyltransferase involved in cell wall biosynthesis